MLNRNGKNNSNGNFDWKDAVMDAGIIAGLTFFTSLGGMAIVIPLTPQTIIGSAVASATQFFLMLAIKRGLRKE